MNDNILVDSSQGTLVCCSNSRYLGKLDNLKIKRSFYLYGCYVLGL